MSRLNYKLNGKVKNVEASTVRMRGLALKGTRDEFSSDEDVSQDDNDEDVGLIARSMFKGKKKFFKRRPNGSQS